MSAVSSSSNVEGSEGEKEQQHGMAVVVFNLGHGRAWRWSRAAAARCSGSVLLAVHERVESEGETEVWRGENERAQWGL